MNQGSKGRVCRTLNLGWQQSLPNWGLCFKGAHLTCLGGSEPKKFHVIPG